MAHFRHFSAMLWKNWLLKRRNPISSLCELLLPIGFVLIMVGLYSQFDTIIVPDTGFYDQSVSPMPIGFLAGRLQKMNSRLALVAAGTPATRQLRDSFQAHLAAMYPEFNGSTIGGGGFSSPVLRSVYSPSLASMTVTFDSDGDLAAYIKAADYRKEGFGPPIWAAITFYEGAPKLDYAIRMNGSDVFNTLAAAVNPLQRNADLPTLRNYARIAPQVAGGAFARPQSIDPVLLQPYPGFMSLQLAVDRWAINASTPLSNMDPTRVLSDLFAGSLEHVVSKSALTGLNLTKETEDLNNAGRINSVLAGVMQYFRAESYAPQAVDFVAFPVTGYKSNNFYTTVLGLFAFFFVIVVLFPLSRLIRGVVMEKEGKLREGMRMMGLTDASWYFSWMVMYAIFFAVLALIIAAVTSNNIFSASNFGMIWFYFFLFGLSCTTFAQLISVFFSRAKTASTVGVVLYLAGYFPFFAVQPAEVTNNAKQAAALLAPTAFGLGIELIGTLEADGTGASVQTATAFVNNWTLQQSIGMLILDTFLYAVLAWYIDAVMPAKYREFGVPRPWYFPFTSVYWREVLNLPAVGADKPTTPLVSSKEGSSTGVPKKSSCLPSWLSFLGPTDIEKGCRAHNGPPTDPALLEEADSECKAKEATGRAVTIHKLRKAFQTPDGVKVAVDDIDMTMYEGQIFVLLGHNGAGKTTTISMLTGLIEPTDGQMNVFGQDVGLNLADIRQDLGVCPQHDVLWPELTVEEHLQIFCAIKGVPQERVKDEINKALQQVGLTEKLKYKSGALSGGQKRKLSVCIALCGGSRFILLDEPTSGMDPYSRRSTWQILQNAREGRVLLLTTHFMDEADILGDRICIMAQGQVKCCGSPTFLKRSYGVGYILTLVKDGSSTGSAAAVELVRSFVPEAEVGSDVGAELVLRLPLTASPHFPAMLAAIDGQGNTLGIAQYGVSVSDIQDVFMKVAAGEHMDDKLKTEHSVAAPSAGTEAEVDAVKLKSTTFAAGGETVKVSPVGGEKSLDAVRAEGRVVQSGFATFSRHFRALFWKRMQSSRRDAKALCYQILIPVIMTLGGLALLKASQFTDFPTYQMTTAVLNTGRNQAQPRHPNRVPFATYKVAGSGSQPDTGYTSLITSIPADNATTSEARLALSSSDLAGMDSDNYYGFMRLTQASPVRDWARMSTFLLKDKLAYAGSKYGAYLIHGDMLNRGRIVSTGSATAPFTPVPSQAAANGDNVLAYSAFVNTTWRHGAPTLVNLLNTEAYKAARGDPNARITTRSFPLPFTVRQSNLISAFFTFSAAIIIVMAFAFFPASVAIFVTKEREVSAKHQQLISGVSISAYWLSNYAFDLMTYIVPSGLSILLTYLFDIREFVLPDYDRVRAFILLFVLYGTSVIPFTYCMTYLFKSHSTAQNVSLIVGIIAMILMIASLIMSQVESTCRADGSLRFVWRLLPGFSLGNGLISLSFLTQLPLIDSACDQYQGIRRPASAYQPYMAWENSATGYNLLYMGVLSPVYMALAILIDLALAHPRFRLLLTGKDANTVDIPEVEDADVAYERARVATEAAGGQCTDVVQIRALRKVYHSGKVAVKNLSFGMPVGEVFGFLGINGAGKTTTLQMLSGDVLPTQGSALLGGYDIIRQQPDVRRLLGYCPQWDALLENLTTREHLELYARIKGIPESMVKGEVESSMEALDLTSFSNKLAYRLSGGNKRKLSVAIALIGSPPIVFLDEPSTGMDPVAKRFMWRVISRVATERKLCSIILTTHSMEEVEALCTRIGIMVGGRLRCLGSSQHLKNRHGAGFVSEIRLQEPAREEVAAVEARIVSVVGSNADVPGQAGTLARADVGRVSVALERPERAGEVSEAGHGWAIQAAFAGSHIPSEAVPIEERRIGIHDFAAWWAEEAAVERLQAYFARVFPGSECVERQGPTVRFRVPPSADKLADLFARLEASRAPVYLGGCAVASYTLGQTSLEQIFNTFAAQQDEEKNVARGMIVKAAESGAVQATEIKASA